MKFNTSSIALLFVTLIVSSVNTMKIENTSSGLPAKGAPATKGKAIPVVKVQPSPVKPEILHISVSVNNSVKDDCIGYVILHQLTNPAPKTRFQQNICFKCNVPPTGELAKIQTTIEGDTCLPYRLFGTWAFSDPPRDKKNISAGFMQGKVSYRITVRFNDCKSNEQLVSIQQNCDKHTALQKALINNHKAKSVKVFQERKAYSDNLKVCKAGAAAIKNQIETNKKEIISLQAKVKSTEQERAKLDARLAQARINIANYNIVKSELEGKFNAIEAEKKSNESVLEEIKTELSGRQGDLELYLKRVTTNKNDLDKNTNEIKQFAPQATPIVAKALNQCYVRMSPTLFRVYLSKVMD